MPQDQLRIQREEQSLSFVANQQIQAQRQKMLQMNQAEHISEHKYVENSPLIQRLQQQPAPQGVQPAPPVQGKMGYFDRKKQESLNKMERKAVEATISANFFEHQAALQSTPYVDSLEKGDGNVLRSRLDAIKLSEKYALARAEADKLGDKAALQIRWEAQRDRAAAYGQLASRLPLHSRDRARCMKQKEDQEVAAHLLKKQLEISQIPNVAERKREEATFVRHGRFDLLKSFLRRITPFSHQDATITIGDGQQTRSLVNVGRAFLGGTKVMYTFQSVTERNAAGQPQEYLYKEATNCIGLYKPEGAIMTEAASKLQHYLRGDNAYIPAYCVRDKTGRVCGSVQKKMDKASDGVDLFSWQAKMDAYDPNDPPEDLPDATKNDLLCEHTLDWILCNFDTKGENFINQPGGHIVSFDKEASFNHLMDDEAQTMSYTYKPHSNETIYNTLFRAYAQGRIDLDLRANLATIERMMAMTDYDFIAMFDNTLAVKYDGNTKKIREAKHRLLSRKNNLRQDYERFYTQLVKERARNITTPHGEVRSSLHPAWKFQFRPAQGQVADQGEDVGTIELEEDMEELVEEQVEAQVEEQAEEQVETQVEEQAEEQVEAQVEARVQEQAQQ